MSYNVSLKLKKKTIELIYHHSVNQNDFYFAYFLYITPHTKFQSGTDEVTFEIYSFMASSLVLFSKLFHASLKWKTNVQVI